MSDFFESNGWSEMKRLVEFRLDLIDGRLEAADNKLAVLVGTLDDIRINQARLDERTNRKAMISGAITGFLAGLTGWLK